MKDLQIEKTLRWTMKLIDPAAAAKHDADTLLLALYQRPKEDDSNARIFEQQS
jgi:hypothetical protein